MAIVTSSIFSRAKGSFGNATLSTQKGRIILKEKAKFVFNPNTPAQQAQRGALRNAVAIYKAIGVLFMHLTTLVSEYGNAYTEFVKKNIDKIKNSNMENPPTGMGYFEGATVVFGKWDELKISGVDKDGEKMRINFEMKSLPKGFKENDIISAFIADKDKFLYHTVTKKLSELSHNQYAGVVELDPITDNEPEDLVFAITAISADNKLSALSHLRSTDTMTGDFVKLRGSELAGSIQ